MRDFFEGDLGLLRRFRQGEKKVLSAVYRHYLPPLTRVVMAGFSVPGNNGSIAHITGLRSPFDIENTCQEVFLRAFTQRARRAFDGQRPYQNYLYRIARNYRIDQHRQTRRLVLVADLPDVAPDWKTPTAEKLLDGAAIERDIAVFLDDLDTTRRGYYVMRFRDGLSQTEAAERLGLTRIQGRRIEGKLKGELLRHLKRRGHGQ